LPPKQWEEKTLEVLEMKFDVSKIAYSMYDLKRGIVIPNSASHELAEFIGIIIGDGYIYHNFNKYRIGIVGNPKEDYLYFVKIKQLIKNLFSLEANIVKRGRGLRIIFGSRAIFEFLTQVIGLPYGRGKGKKVVIPSVFDCDYLRCRTIRGIFDTDGSIFTSHKEGAPDYPCIELTTTSK
jgi:hypothetical protein